MFNITAINFFQVKDLCSSNIDDSYFPITIFGPTVDDITKTLQNAIQRYIKDDNDQEEILSVRTHVHLDTPNKLEITATVISRMYEECSECGHETKHTQKEEERTFKFLKQPIVSSGIFGTFRLSFYHNN